jgi:RpiR family transcriptional regulator, repressor of rpiB and als operon
VRAARDTGATVVAITNSHQSPLAEAADVTLFTSAHEPAEWAEAPAARLSMLALLEALYAATALAHEANLPTERQK